MYDVSQCPVVTTIVFDATTTTTTTPGAGAGAGASAAQRATSLSSRSSASSDWFDQAAVHERPVAMHALDYMRTRAGLKYGVLLVWGIVVAVLGVVMTAVGGGDDEDE